MTASNPEDAWYYASNGQQLGPVSGAEFEQLIRSQELPHDVLCWHSGMEDWAPANSLNVAPDSPVKKKPKLKLVKKNTAPAAASSGHMVDAAPLPTRVESPERALDVHELLGGRQPARKRVGKSFLLEDEKLSERSFEFMFFTVCLLFAFFATAVVYFIHPDYLALPSTGLGALCVIVGAVIFRIRTFQANVWWGVGGLFLGITDLFFICLHWERSWRALLLIAMGTFFTLAAINFGYDQAIL